LTEQLLAGKNIAILVANGFEEVEMTEPQRALLKAGAKPKVISPEQGLVNGWHGAAWGHYFPTDRHVGEVLAADFDLLVLPGGDRSVAKLAGNPHTRRIISSFVDAGKGIVAFGKGVELLALAERIKGRTVTGADSARAALEAAGAKWSDDAVVQDRVLLTAKSNENMADLIDAMLRNFATAVELRSKQAA
jgi:protease I